MRYFCQIMVLCLCCWSCSRSETALALELTDTEQQALAFLKKDPFMRVTHVKRLEDERLLVTTRQGNERIYYHIDTSVGETPKSQILPVSQHIVFRENF